MNHDRDRERERGGEDGYDSVQQNYYQRSWGDHPDLRSLDGRSQASEGPGERQIQSVYSDLFYSIIRHSTAFTLLSFPLLYFPLLHFPLLHWSTSSSFR